MGEKELLIDDMRVQYLKNVDERLAVVINKVGAIKYQIYSDSFAFLVYEIIGQMLSKKVASVISERFDKLSGNDILPGKIVKILACHIFDKTSESILCYNYFIIGFWKILLRKRN